MWGEPSSSSGRDALKCTRFLEQMCRSFDDLEVVLIGQRGLRLTVQLHHDPVVPAHDQEGHRD